MPPRKEKTREVKSDAPSPSPVASSRASSRTRSKKLSDEVVPEEVVPQEDGEVELGDGVEAEAQKVEEQHEEVVEAERDGDAMREVVEDGVATGAAVEDVNGIEEVVEEGNGVDAGEGGSAKMSMADRLVKLKDLRIRMVGLNSVFLRLSLTDVGCPEPIDGGESTRPCSGPPEIQSHGQRAGPIGEAAQARADVAAEAGCYGERGGSGAAQGVGVEYRAERAVGGKDGGPKGQGGYQLPQ